MWDATGGSKCSSYEAGNRGEGTRGFCSPRIVTHGGNGMEFMQFVGCRTERLSANDFPLHHFHINVLKWGGFFI